MCPFTPARFVGRLRIGSAAARSAFGDNIPWVGQPTAARQFRGLDNDCSSLNNIDMNNLSCVLCIGGGPAGLYFGLLLKKQRPGCRVVVVERNRPDDTFGWGVVLSDQTLENLRVADAESARLIGDAFNHWDDIEVFYKGRSVRSTGHGFCGIGRMHLLGILQDR